MGWRRSCRFRAIYPGLKIIAVAENGAGSELRTAKLFGADSVMSKPLVGSTLCAAVHDQIGGADSSAAKIGQPVANARASGRECYRTATVRESLPCFSSWVSTYEPKAASS